MSSIIKQLSTITLATLAVVGVSYVQAAWTGPTATAPLNNTAAPLDVSSSSQTKAGSLTLQGTTSLDGVIDIGNKWRIYPDGDWYANDDWMRISKTDGSVGYAGGIATNNLWGSQSVWGQVLYANDSLCLRGDCRTAWPAAGGGSGAVPTVSHIYGKGSIIEGATYTYTYPGSAKPLSISMSVQTNGASGRLSKLYASWVDASGQVVVGPYVISGTNANGNPSEGGASNIDFVTVPFLDGTKTIRFTVVGNTVDYEILGVTSI